LKIGLFLNLIYRHIGISFLFEEDIAMKSGMIWMALAVAILVSTNAWAWDPDGDAALKFNMNFEVNDNVAHTSTDAKAGLVGTLVDYNTNDPNVFGEASATGLNHDANFGDMHDNAPGGAVSGFTLNYTDCHLDTSSWTPIFDLGGGGEMTVQHTWTFWFNVPSLSDGTVLRHASIHYGESTFENAMWEIRIYGGKLQFYHKNNSLKMETASSLAELGLTVNTWYHAAVVIDRSNVVETGFPTTQLSSKIYVKGLEVPIIVSSVNTLSMNVDTDPYTPAPIWIGAGERNFDGLLDEVRLFSRDLTAVEVSILNQPDKTLPVALLPIPRSSDVVATTGVSWVPSTSAPTAQALYFGKDPNNFGDPCKSGNGSLSSATNAELKGPLARNTKYYWYIKSTIGGVDSNGPLWSFTTETGKALNPSPRDNAQDIDVCDVNLSWTTPTPATYTVYASATKTLVENSDVSVQIYSGTDPCFIGYDPCLRGATIYWRVNSTYPAGGGTMPGDIWSFRTQAYELVFNTSSVEVTYADHNIPAYTCQLHANGWSDACATGSLASDGVAEFDFPSGFNYDKRFDLVVVPEYRATDICSPTHPDWFPTPLAIHVTGNFYFDGRVQIAGDDVTTSSQDITFARSGGFPGPKHNQDISIFNDRSPAITDYWTTYDMPVGYHGRFGTLGTAKVIMVPIDLAKRTFGPGQPVNPPYKGGGGGGYGGIGGDSGRGYFFGVYTAGPTYGDKEVPVPFGGSAGGWGGTATGGAAGGGGIEIAATGDVVLDSNSQINARGGGQLCSAANYPAGGGSGGSVRIIAGGSVTNKGIIDVNGGKGGNANQINNTGGGGGGGRVAIFHGPTGNTYSNTGTVAANGGARGTYSLTLGMGQNGQNGTIFDTNGSTKKASAPTPVNGERMVYTGHPDPCTVQLKWYSGYGGTTDRVYCDTFSPPTTQRGGDVAAARGQHSVNMTVSSGNTYYWKVVTDVTVSSDTWSFKTVNWRCRQYDGADVAPTDPLHVSGPEWDYNRDCVLDIEDFEGFADVWLNPAFDPDYSLEFIDFARFANEWRQCFNRTDGGCAGF
jgi:hypothetical protein